MVLKLECITESTRGLVKRPRTQIQQGWGRGLRRCLSDKIPGDADATGPLVIPLTTFSINLGDYIFCPVATTDYLELLTALAMICTIGEVLPIVFNENRNWYQFGGRKAPDDNLALILLAKALKSCVWESNSKETTVVTAGREQAFS